MHTTRLSAEFIRKMFMLVDRVALQWPMFEAVASVIMCPRSFSGTNTCPGAQVADAKASVSGRVWCRARRRWSAQDKFILF